MAEFHYTECGLDNVYLVNGFELINTPNGEEVCIKDIQDLHKAIAKAILSERSNVLSNREIRFVRHLLDLSQTSLAKILGVTYQTVARWEKGECPISKTADFLLRVYSDSYLNPQENRAIYEKINELSDIDSLKMEIENKSIKLTFNDAISDWKIAS